MQHKYHLTISIAVFFTSGLWGLYWIPQRALENGGLTGGWGTVAQYAIPLIVFTPFIILKFFKGKSTGIKLPLIGLLFGGGIACYANSFLLTDIMRVFILFYLMPVWTTIFEIIFFKQAPKWQRGVSLFLALLGLFIVFGKDGNLPLPVNVGDWLALLGGFLCAAGAIKLEEAKNEDISSLLYSFFFYGLLVTLFTSLIFSDAFGPLPDIVSWISMLPLLLILSLVFFIPSNIIILWSPSKIGAGLFSILVLSEIIFGTISAAFLANETFGWREGVGGLLMLIAGFSEILLTRNKN
ncbi:DMT family transporter [Pelagibacterales bacterium SAG-MED31]|nr:DMT family transporter [Pelagibacterales bacterium SAG-MED31]